MLCHFPSGMGMSMCTTPKTATYQYTPILEREGSFFFFEKEREGRVNTISNILFLLCTNLDIFMFEKTH